MKVIQTQTFIAKSSMKTIDCMPMERITNRVVRQQCSITRKLLLKRSNVAESICQT